MRHVLALCVALFGCGWVHADAGSEPDVRRVQGLISESLRRQAGEVSYLVYSEEVEVAGGLRKRFDWIVAGSIANGGWRMHGRLPSRKRSRERIIEYVRNGNMLLHATAYGEEWDALIEPFDAELMYKNGPTLSNWYPYGALSVEQWVSGLEPLAAESVPDGLVLYVAASERVRKWYADGLTLAGLLGYRLKFRGLQTGYVLAEADAIHVDPTDGGSGKPKFFDDWRKQLGHLRVGRTTQVTWDDYRRIGNYDLPFKWALRDAGAVDTGRVLPETVREITAEEALPQVEFSKAHLWMRRGVIRNTETKNVERIGEVDVQRRAKQLMARAKGTGMRPRPEGSRDWWFIVGIGGTGIGCLAFAVLLGGRRRRAAGQGASGDTSA